MMNDQTAFVELSIDQLLRAEASAQKRKKKALRLVREHGSILDKFTDVVFIVDDAGQFVFVNKATERRSGIPTENFMGRHFLQLIDPQYHEFAQRFFQRILEGEEIPSVEMARQTASGEKITVKVNWAPIYEDNVLVAILGVSHDTTDCNREKEALKRAREELEMRVQERTEELLKANELLEKEIKQRKLAEEDLKKSQKALKVKAKKLEEANTALRVLLKRMQQDRTELEEKVVSSVKELVEPYLKKIQRTQLTERQNAYLSILDLNLKEIVLPFSRSLYAKFMNLTHCEIQIANLVKHGMTNKQIGEVLDLSIRTVEFHRYNIRKKTGIKNTKANLRSYLLSLK